MAESNAILTAAETKQLEKLLAKANAGNTHAPAVRIGEPYVALTNLSLPRRGTLPPGEQRQSDLVMAGDTVYLTPDEVALFERHDPRDGRRISVVRKKTEVDNNNPPKPHPSFLSGPVFRPGPAPKGSDLPRPDPDGSSQLIQYGPPEASQPQPGSENTGTDGPDAQDLPPGFVSPGAAARDEIRQGADGDLMAAVKAQTGVK